jgi:four helix bundle protein
MRVYSFEKLEGWKCAKELAIWIYSITRLFPSDEKFGLVSQMRRSAVSIASNLAEGTARNSRKDQSHFSTISYSSTVELLNHLIISYELKLISLEILEEGRQRIERQTYLISGIRKSQQRKI